MSDESRTANGPGRSASPFFNTARAGHYLGLSMRTLERMRRHGKGPVWRRHGRYVVYHIDDLMAWSDARRGRDYE